MMEMGRLKRLLMQTAALTRDEMISRQLPPIHLPTGLCDELGKDKRRRREGELRQGDHSPEKPGKVREKSGKPQSVFAGSRGQTHSIVHEMEFRLCLPFAVAILQLGPIVHHWCHYYDKL